jgi:predicted amidohydrolase
MDSRITGKQSVKAAFQEVENKLAQGAVDQPDLFLLPEACLTGLAAERLRDEQYFLTPGDDIYQKFTVLAKKYHAYIAATFLTLRGGKRYNSVVCFDRAGEVVWTYDKTYLTPSEQEAGMTPGTQSPDCFEADFGKIGFAICFDLNYRELFENYYCKGMELLLFPSYFPGGRILSNTAFDFSCFAVSSHAQGDESVFIDNYGREFARANMFTPALTRSIELDCKVLHISGNLPKMADIKRKYGNEIEIEVHRPEGRMILRATGEKIFVSQLVKEFGLIPLQNKFP